MKTANQNESQSRLRAHGGFGPHIFFVFFLMDKIYVQNLWTKKDWKKNKKKYIKKTKKRQERTKKRKKGQNKKDYILPMSRV